MNCQAPPNAQGYVQQMTPRGDSGRHSTLARHSSLYKQCPKRNVAIGLGNGFLNFEDQTTAALSILIIRFCMLFDIAFKSLQLWEPMQSCFKSKCITSKAQPKEVVWSFLCRFAPGQCRLWWHWMSKRCSLHRLHEWPDTARISGCASQSCSEQSHTNTLRRNSCFEAWKQFAFVIDFLLLYIVWHCMQNLITISVIINPQAPVV